MRTRQEIEARLAELGEPPESSIQMAINAIKADALQWVLDDPAPAPDAYLYRDEDGDIWIRRPDGDYGWAGDALVYSLEQLREEHGPLTPM